MTVSLSHCGVNRKEPHKGFRNAALVLVDLLKAHSHCFSYGHGSVEQGIGKTVALIHECRSTCVPVVLVTMTRNRELVPEISEAAGQSGMTFQKHKMSAFSNPAFGAYLSSEGIDTLIVGGWIRHLCVMATVSDAICMGYSVMTSDEIMFGVTDILEARARGIALGYFRRNTCMFDNAQDILGAIKDQRNEAFERLTRTGIEDYRAWRDLNPRPAD